MSDRAQANLRGPVKSTTESSTYTDASRKDWSLRSECTTTYGPDGRLLSSRNRNSDGSHWTISYEYSSSGQLLNTASNSDGQAPAETHYSYDSQHRLEKIISNNKSEPTVLFHYDEHGRKTRTISTIAADYRPNVTVGGSLFEAAGMMPNLPGGGTTTTAYDEHDRPVEVQVRGADGELVASASRTYNDQGHVIDETQRYENFVSQFPPETRQKILDESGLSPEQLQEALKAQLANLLQGRAEMYSISNRYDSVGRLIHVERRIFDSEDQIDTTYNEHGDKESEITRGTEPGPESADQRQASFSQTRYSYQYDDHGNWTEQTMEVTSSRDAAFHASTVVKRSLTYY